MYTVKQITPHKTYPVRLPVLRPGKPIESCKFEGDSLPDTVHFGVFDKDIIVGIISIFKSNSILFTEKNQYQLRGMAVLPNYQKKGLGDLLLQAAEKHIAKQNAALIWFNAREIAVGFYKKAGYNINGEAFNIADIGPHYVMYKRL